MSYLIRMASILSRRDTLVLCPASYSKADAVAYVNKLISRAHVEVGQAIEPEKARLAQIPGAGHITVSQFEDRLFSHLQSLLSADGFSVVVPEKLPSTTQWNRRQD